MKQKAITIIKNPLFSGSAIMVIGSMGVNIINYLYHLVMGRLLGPIGYGQLASIFSILYIISIVPISSSFAIVKFISSAKSEKEKSTVYKAVNKLITTIAIMGALILAILSPFITDFLHLHSVFGILLLAPVMFLSLITLVNQASLQGVLKFYGVVGPNLANAIIKISLGVLLVILGFSVNGAVMALLVAIVFSYFYSVKLKGTQFTHKTKNSFNISKFFKYAFPVLIQALAFTSLFTTDILLVKHFLSEFDAGLYAALSTLGKIIFFAAQPITAAMFPIVAGKKSKGERFRTIFLSSFLLTVFVSLSIVTFYYLFPGLTIGLLYGKEYLAAQQQLVSMGIFITIYTTCYILVNFLLSIDKTKIVILPLLSAFLQFVGITIWHQDIQTIINVSILSTFPILLGVIVYLSVIKWSKNFYQLSFLLTKKKRL